MPPTASKLSMSAETLLRGLQYKALPFPLPRERKSLETSATHGQAISYEEGAVSLSEVISALTFALDLTEGAIPGHSLRTCVLGMRLAIALDVPDAELTNLFYALLLKDIGCSDNAARLSQIMGGPHQQAGTMAAALSTNPLLLERIWREVLPGVALPAHIGRQLGQTASQDTDPRRAWEVQSSRSTQIMRDLGMTESTIEAVYHIDERWDGTGLPSGQCGDAIPLLSRLCAVAQTLDAFACDSGPEAAMKMIRSRRGTWFDGSVVRAAQSLHTSGRLWQHCHASDVEETRAEVLQQDPGVFTPLNPERVDSICEAFGNVVDAKSPFTYSHSLGVTEIAVQLSQEMGLTPERLSLVRRAAFLHDIGKLAVPNRILDKRGKLTPREWTVITRHPALSGSILKRVSAFREIAVLAAEHHERLDGSGYPFGLQSHQISLESRIIALSDCYAAMAEDRPYRVGLASSDILTILAYDVPQKLDGHCFEALQRLVQRWDGQSMPGRSAPVHATSKRPSGRSKLPSAAEILATAC